MRVREMTHAAAGVVAAMIPVCAEAAQWTWSFPTGAAGENVQVEVCPYLYGKQWAYAVEIDDGPKLVVDVAQPLLAKQQFSDAPPGVAGGKPLPFVGGVSVMVVRVGGNNTLLSWDDLRKLKELGWGAINHSYFHKGRTWGNPPEILSAEQIREDLFWSQSIIAAEMGEAPTHFVYPNGYMGYAEYLGEFGMFSGTRVGGSGVRFPYAAEAKHLETTRSYLDEGSWKNSGKADPMWDFPADPGPGEGQLVIDFTHGIDKPGTENHGRWEQRLQTIGAKYGIAGKDDVWCAPSGAVFDYVNARKRAKVSAGREGLSVALPDDLAGSRLTLKLTGASGEVGDTPPGTLVYRQGDTMWITTPTIGRQGAKTPTPGVKRVYSGEAKDVVFEQPVEIAAVRLMQFGKPAPDSELKLTAMTPDGAAVSLVSEDQKKLPDAWGTWHLYNRLPHREAVKADRVEVTADRAIVQMEIWAKQ